MRRCGVLVVAALLAACGGGGGPGSATSVASGSGAGSGAVNPACEGFCANAGTALGVVQVEGVIARAVAEAQARNARATIAVVDRVGNVLAVYAMNGAASAVTVRSTRGSVRIEGGLEGLSVVPTTMAAIAKAVTGAYLSSEGNAFSTRTASQIVQSHFNPGEALAPGGPLFGVQFSQLACSDLSARFAGSAPDAGPKRSPLGLAADPGGFPLYLAGTPVGGVGVIADGLYSLDPNIIDRDDDLDEAIALAATVGLAAPEDRRADRITADGKTLRFSDVEASGLRAVPSAAPVFSTLGTVGALLAVPGYATATIRAGTPFGQAVSGIRADTLDYPGLDAFVLVDAAGVERYRPRAGTEPAGALTAAEVQAILRAALGVANRSRAQIRRPLGTPARVTISMVDSNGTILGITRTRDAPVFGIDVSLQKARTAAFFSSPRAAALLQALPPAVYLDGGLTVLRADAPGAGTAWPAERARGWAGGVHGARGGQPRAAELPRRCGWQPVRTAREACRPLESVQHGSAARHRAQRDHPACRLRRGSRAGRTTQLQWHQWLRQRLPAAGAGLAARQRHPDLPGCGAGLSWRDAGRCGWRVR